MSDELRQLVTQSEQLVVPHRHCVTPLLHQAAQLTLKPGMLSDKQLVCLEIFEKGGCGQVPRSDLH